MSLDRNQLLEAVSEISRELAEQTHAKPWWTSKTLWVNALTLAGAAAGYGLGVNIELSADEAAALAGAVIATANIVLRITTRGPLRAK